MESNKPRLGFNLDIVGGAVGSLCEALREATRLDETGHWVNLLFDRESPSVVVESPYTHPGLTVRLKTPAPLFVRIPPWADIEHVHAQGFDAPFRRTNSYLFISHPPVNRAISIEFAMAPQEINLKNPDGPIRVRLKGDQVVAMDNLGADLTFFDPID
jgi:hypothetical protein